MAKLPDIPQTYAAAADVVVHQGKLERAVELLDQMAGKFGLFLTPESSGDPDWKQFFASDQYQKGEADQKTDDRESRVK